MRVGKKQGEESVVRSGINRLRFSVNFAISLLRHEQRSFQYEFHYSIIPYYFITCSCDSQPGHSHRLAVIRTVHRLDWPARYSAAVGDSSVHRLADHWIFKERHYSLSGKIRLRHFRRTDGGTGTGIPYFPCVLPYAPAGYFQNWISRWISNVRGEAAFRDLSSLFE